jgi:hypothetical protein
MKAHYDFGGARRGAIDPLPSGKTRITIAIDDEILDWFRGQVNAAGGGNYQTLMNHALSLYVQRHLESLDTTLRKVMREELANYTIAKADPE